MKKKLVFITFFLLALFFLSGSSLLSQPLFASGPDKGEGSVSGPQGIKNPLLPTDTGADIEAAKSGTTLAFFFIYFWNILIIVGGLAVVIIFIMGAFDWITAGGEKGKIDSARLKIVNAVIGMIILAGSFAVIEFISNLFGLNLLNPTLNFLTPGAAGQAVEQVQTTGTGSNSWK